jgi:hypothetical protein
VVSPLQPSPIKILAKQFLNGLTIVLGIAIIVSAITLQWIEVGTWLCLFRKNFPNREAAEN